MAVRVTGVLVLTALSACVIALPPPQGDPRFGGQSGDAGQRGRYLPRSNTRWSDLGVDGGGAGRGQVPGDSSTRASFSREEIPLPARDSVADNETGFRVAYAQSRDPGMDRIRAAFQAEQIFEKYTASLNSVIKMPRVVDVQLADCGMENAFYSPKDTRIVLCYEFIALIARTFQPHIKDETQLGTAIIGATFFVLFHEIGHALRHQLDLPVTGKEEDAVDQVATLILMSQGAEGVQAVLSSAYWFHLKSNATTPGGKAAEQMFWDEHSLDQQRFYSIACLIYGADPKGESFLVEKKILPVERAERCPAEYQQIASAWGRLLAPHRATAAEVASAPPATAGEVESAPPTTAGEVASAPPAPRSPSGPEGARPRPKTQVDDAERMNQEGKRLFAARDLRAARRHFVAAIKLRIDPRYVYNLCLCELALGDLEGARSTCSAVLELRPDARLAAKARETLASIERAHPDRELSDDERLESDGEPENDELANDELANDEPADDELANDEPADEDE